MFADGGAPAPAPPPPRPPHTWQHCTHAQRTQAFFATVPACVVSMSAQQFAIAVGTILAAFWFKGNEGTRDGGKYEFYHAMWHATIAVGQFFLAAACAEPAR